MWRIAAAALSMLPYAAWVLGQRASRTACDVKSPAGLE
jgi:hypothetical protein